jgi:HD-GYP domain-containing protein (c-di-GMP phosphodiesterase class II)
MKRSSVGKVLEKVSRILFEEGKGRRIWEGKVSEEDLRTMLKMLEEYIREQVLFFNRLTTIGISLSREKNIENLLEKILTSARKITNADAGTLYLVDQTNKRLTFEIVQNDSMNLNLQARGDVFDSFPPVPLEINGSPNLKNVSSYVALTGEKVNIPDVYQAEGFDFTGTKSYDANSGYRSKSMLVIPMKNHQDETIGVLQIINALSSETRRPVPFVPEDEGIAGALASQAAVCMTKNQLIQDLENLLEAFIKSIATAIDDKSPHTGRHVNRVVDLVMLMAQELNSADSPPFKEVEFTPDELEEMRIASWLHDVGKISTPEHILDKRSRLEGVWDREELIKTRFCLISLCLENQYLKKKGEPSAEADKQADFDNYKLEQEKQKDDFDFLLGCNKSERFINDQDLARIEDIAKRTYTFAGESFSYLTAEELEMLSIRRGNLTHEERKIIEKHAEVTQKILGSLPFPKKLSRVAEFASMHHERMDGTGYNLGVGAKDIPLQARIIALADVFEALTATDRPYKKPITIDKALQILEHMKEDNHLDPALVDFFIRNRIYEKYSDKHLKDCRQ